MRTSHTSINLIDHVESLRRVRVPNDSSVEYWRTQIHEYLEENIKTE
jgi:hypothetical protein